MSYEYLFRLLDDGAKCLYEGAAAVKCFESAAKRELKDENDALKAENAALKAENNRLVSEARVPLSMAANIPKKEAADASLH